jgi:hypothetical protein
MRSLFRAAVIVSWGICAVGSYTFSADAQPVAAATTRPATLPASGAGLRVTIVEVKGNVQVRASENDPWQAAKIGTEVSEGAELRTMPKSSVRCTIAPDQSFTLDRLGIVKVAEAARRGNKIKTDLMMKYGRTKLVVEAAGEEHESTISSPGGSLAVGGTVVSLYDQPPFTPEATSYTGRAAFRDLHRQVGFGGKGQKTTVVRADRDSAAETALASGITDPQFAGARTESDSRFIANEVARGGIISYDPLARITVVRNSPPLNDRVLIPSLPPIGLTFVLRWFGNADLNLEVLRAAGEPLTLLGSGKSFVPDEFLFPGYGLNIVPSGGRIPFDHRGGVSGGQEIAYWRGTAPHGIYGLGVLFVSGIPVDLQLNAFLNGKKQIVESIDGQGNLLDQLDFKTTASASSPPIAALVYIPALPPLGAQAVQATPAAIKKSIAVLTPQGGNPKAANSAVSINSAHTRHATR